MTASSANAVSLKRGEKIRRLLARAGARWDRYWFAEVESYGLDLGRIVFYALLFIYYAPENLKWSSLEPWSRVSVQFWVPVSFFKLVPLRVTWGAALRWISRTWVLALFCASIGLFTRASAFVAGFLGLFVLCYPCNFGKIHHANHLAALFLAILAFARLGDSLSVDRFLRQQLGGRSAPPKPAGEYLWPIRLVRLGMCLAYTSAGFQKWRNSGVEWFLSDNLANTMLAWGKPLGVYCAIHLRGLCHVLAAWTMGCESLAFLAIFSIPAALVIIPSLFAFHTGARLTMGVVVAFTPWMLCYVWWLPFEHVNKVMKSYETKRSLSRHVG